MSPTAARPLTITIVYDNNAYAPALNPKWGFAAVVAHSGRTMLFDTGGDGAVLLSNMAALGIAPETIEHVVLSHAHNDHTGGLQAFLATGARPVVHLPPSFGDSFKRQIGAQTTVVETVPGALVMEDVFVTGELPGQVPEQALVLETDQGLVIITGCAHPGVDRMIARAREIRDRPIYLVLGGFHLGSASTGEVTRILRALRDMGVQQVAPCHCTGERAIAAFADEYGEGFLRAGVGLVIVVESQQR
jgi:7,8-dihydropterin-6-yl-methyl-4-(beta-D-ribofuranosyl)aminobenzene 5'-phosphate synthase